MRCWALIPLGYFVGGILTFAWAYDGYKPANQYDNSAAPSSLVAGLAWPVYWSGRGALYAVRAAKTPPLSACMDATGNSWKPDSDGICRYAQR